MKITLLNPAFWLKVMRISCVQMILLLVCAGMSPAADIEAQVLEKLVSLNVEDQEIGKTLREIEKQAAVKFVFSPQVIRAGQKINVRSRQEKLGELLDKMLAPLGISYEVSGKYILLIDGKKTAGMDGEVLSPGVFVDRVLRGKVTDEKEETLPGVSIVLKGTQKGTISAIDGSFELSVPDGENNVLIFSFVGYLSQEVEIGNRVSLDVSLKVDEKSLEEVVVVGYGTQRKKDITGSVVSIKSEQFLQPSANSFDQMLQGKVPGVQISQTTGAPGGNVNILIRGISSITGGNQPLYVIDGFPIGSGGGGSNMRSYGASTFSSAAMANNTATSINPLSSINPSDIESIEILKDASATAIYGSRGANGVVIITTKRGAYGKSQISVDASYGFQEVANKLKLLNSRQYAEFVADARDNAWVYAGGKRDDPNSVRSAATRVRPEFRNPESITTDTDWQDVIFRVAPVRNLQLSSAGGTEKARFMISGGYFSQEGIIINSDYNRFNLRVNVDAQIAKRVKIGTSTYGSYGYGRFANTESHYGQGGILSNVLSAAPTIPVYDADGNYYFNQADVTDGLGFLQNVLAVSNGTEDRRKAMDIFTNNFIEIDLGNDLAFKSTVGINYNSNAIRLWRSSAVPNFTSLNYPATAGATKTEALNWLNENTLNYNKVFDQKHFINGIVGFTAQKAVMTGCQSGRPTSLPSTYRIFLPES